MNKEDWTLKYQFIPPGNKVFLGKQIRGQFAKDFLEKYQEFVDSRYKGHPFLKNLKFRDNHLVDQNLFSSVVIEELLRKIGFRSQIFNDLDYFRKEDWNSVLDSKIDFGVVFRGVNYCDKKQSQDFSKILEKRGFVVNKDYEEFVPIFVPLGGLEIKFNKEYKEGIGVSPSGPLVPLVSTYFDKAFSGKQIHSFNKEGPFFNGGNLGEMPGSKSINFNYSGSYELSRVYLSKGNYLEAGGSFHTNFRSGRTWIFSRS